MPLKCLTCGNLGGDPVYMFLQKPCRLSVNWFLNPEVSRTGSRVPSQEWNRWAKLLLPPVQSGLWRCLMMVYFSKQGFRSTSGESRLYWIPGLLPWAFASVASERKGFSCWRQGNSWGLVPEVTIWHRFQGPNSRLWPLRKLYLNDWSPEP